ncbi:MAG: nucleolar complex protein 14 [Caeruleum heppii]|nr:MAG: nucleolar complex protein 14 [Caeruleum heppii]
MPPSQLKQLKASLRTEGIVGPQQSKKQKKRNSSNGANTASKVHRSAALAKIREQFNPFEVQPSSWTKEKFSVTTSRNMGGKVTKGVKARPGVTKGLGEETRRKTLLVEMQRRKKVGGIMDRRFGEDDPTMAPEDKMLERFTKEKQRGFKKSSLFDLENEEEEGQLTHFGQSLSLDQPDIVDDFDEGNNAVSEQSSDVEAAGHSLKRRRSSAAEDPNASADDNEENAPHRKKTKAEVMKEVMAKSKFHKYERRQGKEDDDEERELLDKELPDLLALMRGDKPALPPPNSTIDASGMNPERATMIEKLDRDKADQEYDKRLREMTLDRRSKPTERTKTEEEKAEEEAERLRRLEAQRIRRMKGLDQSSDEEEDQAEDEVIDGDQAGEPNDANDFGLGPSLGSRTSQKDVQFDDEDDFILDDDLVASGSATDVSDGESVFSDVEGAPEETDGEDDDDEFTGGLLSADDRRRPEFNILSNQSATSVTPNANQSLAYTYPCPQTHEELLEVFESVKTQDLPLVIQRIRALYHPQLHAENKAKLGLFAVVLVDHLAYLANISSRPPFGVLETLIRHIHSLAKKFPIEVGQAFRRHLQDLHQNRPTSPTAGDLLILSAIASIFPTSDHFHSVVTPAMLTMGRYLGQSRPTTLHDLAKGAYVETLCLQYQRLSKRYIPELINYALNALCNLAPERLKNTAEAFPRYDGGDSIRLRGSLSIESQKLSFQDMVPSGIPDAQNDPLKTTLLTFHVTIIDMMARMWVGELAFYEIFGPALQVLQHLGSKPGYDKLTSSAQDCLNQTSKRLQDLLHNALIARKPLELHHHRPLAIKTSLPKFEESYNPDKHYDPDRERAAMAKLEAEHKRERKGAMRELRKDANFMARESLREKKERDREYERKYKRLVAEIQGEEGREGKNYEREKRLRKSSKKGR